MSSSPSSRIVSRRAKQQLVQLLFGSDLRRQGPQAHRMLDPTQYKYQDLRKAYLERLQKIHPDKSNHHTDPGFVNVEGADALLSSPATHRTKKELHDEFVKLQEAWQDYEKLTKTILKARQDTSNGAEESNFTRFGVGCSFSDSPEERRERDEIMDQASRGFFFSGTIPEKTVTNAGVKNSSTSGSSAPLTDESLFVLESSNEPKGANTSKEVDFSTRKTLVLNSKQRKASRSGSFKRKTDSK